MPASMPPTRTRAADFAAVTVSLLAAWAVAAPSLVLGEGIPTSHEGGLRSDLLDVALPLLRYAAEGLRRGAPSFWYDGGFLGLPLGALPEAMLGYPPSLGLFVLLSPVRAMAWLLLLHALWAGLGAAALAARQGLSRPALCLAALSASLGLWLPNHFRQVNLTCAAAWVPWVWWAWDRWLTTPERRSAAALGLCMGLMTLAGHLQIVHHTTVVLLFWSAARWRHVAARPWATAAWLPVAGSISALVAAPHLVLMAEAIAHSHRVAALADAVRFPPRPAMLAALVHPSLAGTPLAPAVSGAMYWEDVAHVGLCTLLLALGFTVRRVRAPAWWPWVLTLAAALWLAYGRGFALTGWLHRLVPGMALARFEQRHLWFVSLALSVLGAAGLDALCDWLRVRSTSTSPRLLSALPWLLVGLQALLLTGAMSAVCPVQPPRGLLEPPLTDTTLRRGGLRPETPGRRVLGFTPRTLHSHLVAVGGFGAGDLSPHVEARRLLVPQHAHLWGWRTADGYFGLVPTWVQAAVGDQHRPGVLETLALRVDQSRHPDDIGRYVAFAAALGVDAVIAPFVLPSEALVPEAEQPGAFVPTVVHRVARPVPSARVVRGEVRFVRDEDAVASLLRDEVNLHRVLITAGAPATLPGGPVTPARWQSGPNADTFTVHATLDTPGTLVLTQGYHPRWLCALDGGSRAPMQRVNLAQMGRPLAPGHHRLECRFDARRERAALAAMVVGLLLALALLVRPRTRVSPAS